MTEQPAREQPLVLLAILLLVLVAIGSVVAVVMLLRIADTPRPSISQRQVDCVEAGGAPVVIGYGHSHYRVVCFRPDAVLWTDSEFQSKEPDHD